ncbi:hypothetical protein LDR16_003446 [Salmonella enterica]|nr:hypothetical protein [Salmonella enterica subsp. houtenae]EIE5970091.1 hypothetical protein [Salmonella enterica]
MLQMKFKPRFIEAFRSGQKITSLRMMDFRCRCYDSHDYPPVYIHSDTLKYRMHVDIEGLDLSLPSGLAVKYATDLTGLLKRQPYRPGDDIELVAKYESGETVPFATATIGDISVIKGDRIEDVDAIHDGFNPDRNPLSEMFWLYTFTNIQMLPMWGGAA